MVHELLPPSRAVNECSRVRSSRSLPHALMAAGASLFAMLAAGKPAAAAIAYVQSAAHTSGILSTVQVPFAGAQQAGSVNVVFIGWLDSKSHVLSVTDTQNNVYTLANTVLLSGNATQTAYYAKNIVAAAANGNTVTVTFNAKVNQPDVRIAEYSGIDPANPVDVMVGSTGNYVTTSSGTIKTTNANDLLVASNFSQRSITGPGTGFTKRLIDSYAQILEDKAVTQTGAYSATAPQSKSGWYVMQMIAFRTATVTAPPTPTPPTPAPPTPTPPTPAPPTPTPPTPTPPAPAPPTPTPPAPAPPTPTPPTPTPPAPAPPVASSPYAASPILGGISWDESGKQRYAAGSDIWDSTWSSDGMVYGVWGDGDGFAATGKKQIGISSLAGSPASPPLVGADVYLGSPYPATAPCAQKPTLGGKPHGLVGLPGAVIYLFHSTQDLCVSHAWLARSGDNGMTWSDFVGSLTWPDANGFSPVAILQYGPAQAGALAPDQTLAQYIYIYAGKNNPGAQYLARVPALPSNAIESPDNWSYFAGMDSSGNPTWSPSSANAAPVWSDSNYAESVEVVFDPGIGRYIAYNDHGNACGGSPCERQVSLFDAPSPWGPWTTFDYEENFDNANCGSNCLGNLGAVGWAMIQKWISPDGLGLWVQYSSQGAYDSLNLIQGRMQLASGSTVTSLAITTGTPAVVDILSLNDPGNLEFIDRPDRFTSFPPAYIGKEVIRLAKNDAAVGDLNYVSFNSTVAQNVCVAWDAANALPAWLSTWVSTGQSLVGSATFNIYSNAYPAGPVTLPGPASGDGYILMVGC
jgi:hypothetical protein